MSSKFLSPEEFAEWSERHSPEEILQKSIELREQLAQELCESANVTREEYISASSDAERDMMVQAGGQVWLDEEADRQELIRQFRPPEEVDRIFISDEPDPDTVEIEVPFGGALDKHLMKGMVKGSFAEDSAEGQEAVQAQFIALHPEFQLSEHNGNLIRDRVAASGARYFTLENIEQAFRELVAEGGIDIPYSFN